MTGGGTISSADEPSPEPEDVLDIGSPRGAWFNRLMNPQHRDHSGGRSIAALAIALTLGLAVAFAVHRAPGPSGPPSQPKDVVRISLSDVRALADRASPLRTYIRQTSAAGACALVPVGRSPRRAISDVVRRAFPGYRFEDSGSTLDQFTGLCAIQLRAVNSDEATLIVSVTSPTAHARAATYTQLETGIETDGAVTTKYAVAVNPSGWTVLIGATGRTADLPAANDLMHTVQESALTW